MTDVFGPDGCRTLAGLARLRLLVAFDFDGTLAPIVAARNKATMRPETRRLVAEVCSLYPCAVISGRARSDVEARVAGLGVKHVVGNHGIEPCPRMEEFEKQTLEACRLLQKTLAHRDDVDLENKRYSLAVHYRRARDRMTARRAIRLAVAVLPMRMRVIPGKLVVNFIPWGAPNKGDALLEIKRREQADAALYVGDDVTDEDVFRLSDSVVSVRVGPSVSSAAMHYLQGQQQIDALLERLAELRRPLRF